ncbi:DUF1349 domain-containing protein [Plantactinospora sp. KBS50]|uniref:DUF1349 domain-containing protein n=1 Tax=Plantactinospora sp. KBS50 TaxID=2024580 RepID=UPI000BAB1817|nr:DUF1349 domain-containing protein [Plantactinospora sp. KBS50]ASW56538.1 hypothetical protein CIK06_23825 [Plantactinospora sp. KBS50]
MGDAAPRDRRIGWNSGTWLNPPVRSVPMGDGELLVTAAAGTDFWRRTAYGHVHDDGHALLAPLPPGTAVEVRFVADYTEQFDQAGLLVRVDAERWLKTGVEFCDGALQLGAVRTDGVSDWSTAPVPEWDGCRVTVRVSRRDDALTVRARADGEPWRLVRLAPLPPDAPAQAGPYCCAPTRADLTVRFLGWTADAADAALHPDPA